MVEFALVPGRSALVNVDVQNCFVEGGALAADDARAVIGRINRVAAACRSAGIPVIHVSHVLRPDGSDAGVLGEIAPSVRDGVIAKGSPSAALHASLEVDPRDLRLDKPRFGAFHGTDLERMLRARGVDTVIITGISTNVCCETTAREATVRDFRVFFVSDGTANSAVGDLPAAEVRRASCATLAHMFAQVLTVAEMIGRIERAGAPLRQGRGDA
jgi:nicotinamidase-related amidase